MRLATIRTADGTRAVRVDDEHLVDLGVTDVGELLRQPGWRDTVSGRPRAERAKVTYPVAGASFAPVVPRPSKVICVRGNFRNVCLEEGRLLKLPVLLPRSGDTLIGAYDDLVKPAGVDELDWDTSLAVVIGDPVHRANEAEAAAAIGGFSVLNDVSLRGSKFRSTDRAQSRVWDHSSPVGPWLVTPDELPGGVRPAVAVRSSVNDTVQHTNTTTFLVEPVHLVRYISKLVALKPGDIIAIACPPGQGHAYTPKRYLGGGESVVSAIEGIGGCGNRILGED